MALPFKLGRLRLGRSKKTSNDTTAKKSRLGLRGSLLLAFMAIAATSIVIAGGASFLLNQLSGMNKVLTEQDVPRLTTAMQLSELSESLSSNGPTLLNAPTETTRAAAAQDAEGNDGERRCRGSTTCASSAPIRRSSPRWKRT